MPVSFEANQRYGKFLLNVSPDGNVVRLSSLRTIIASEQQLQQQQQDASAVARGYSTDGDAQVVSSEDGDVLMLPLADANSDIELVDGSDEDETDYACISFVAERRHAAWCKFAESHEEACGEAPPTPTLSEMAGDEVWRTAPNHAACPGTDGHSPCEDGLAYLCLDCGNRHSEIASDECMCGTCGLRICHLRSTHDGLCRHCTERVVQGVEPVTLENDSIPTVCPSVIEALCRQWVPCLEMDVRLIDLHWCTKAALAMTAGAA